MNKETADITIIGGGPGGYVAAIKAAQLGAKVILVEKDKLGGTCLNKGCIPTKALVRSAEIFKNLKEAGKYGCQAEKISLDMEKVIKRKNKVVSQLVGGIQYLLKSNNVKVIQGVGKIKAPMTVNVESSDQEVDIKTDSIIIATGSQTSKLPIKGIDLEGVISSDEALELKTLPEDLVIVGGGIIGLEFAFIFANFGAKVTVVEYLDSLLPKAVDEDIAKEIEKMAKQKGIDVFTGSKVEEISRYENDKYLVSFSKNGDKKEAIGDKVLMAVGREPFFDNTGVKELGIALNENGRGIKVNERMQTSIPNIYAIGDVTDKILLAHVASHQGIIAVKNILGENSKMRYDTVPIAIFTDPEIATVGIDERTARKMSYPIKVGRFPFSANGKVLTAGADKGFIKIITDKSTGRVIGGSIFGIHATDLIGELTLAIKNELTVNDIIDTIHAHPTTAEVIHEAALSAGGGAIHYIE